MEGSNIRLFLSDYKIPKKKRVDNDDSTMERKSIIHIPVEEKNLAVGNSDTGASNFLLENKDKFIFLDNATDDFGNSSFGNSSFGDTSERFKGNRSSHGARGGRGRGRRGRGDSNSFNDGHFGNSNFKKPDSKI